MCVAESLTIREAYIFYLKAEFRDVHIENDNHKSSASWEEYPMQLQIYLLNWFLKEDMFLILLFHFQLIFTYV